MKKPFLVIIILLLLVGNSVYVAKLFKRPVLNLTIDTGPLTIILSPHFDDAVLSLGGLLAKREHGTMVATFFTHRPTKAMHTEWDRHSGFSDSNEAMFKRTKENENALSFFNAVIKNYDYPDLQYRKENEDNIIRGKIAEDIKTLMQKNQKRELFIYGPATFGTNITHPDHQIVHDAFMDVWRENKEPRIHFFMYEDFPYAREFSMSDLGILKTYLEKTEHIQLKENPITLHASNLLEKISAIYRYTSQVNDLIPSLDIRIATQKFYKERCKTLIPTVYACEVVYTVL